MAPKDSNMDRLSPARLTNVAASVATPGCDRTIMTVAYAGRLCGHETVSATIASTLI